MSTKSEAQDIQFQGLRPKIPWYIACLLYTSDAADE